MNAFTPQVLRNYDLFRWSNAKKEVKVALNTLNKWSKDKDGTGPRKYRMNGETTTFGRYSEVEAYVASHSTVVKEKKKE